MSTRFGFTQEIKTPLYSKDSPFYDANALDGAAPGLAIRARPCELVPNPSFNGTVNPNPPTDIDSELCNRTADLNSKFFMRVLEPAVKAVVTERMSLAAKNDYIPYAPIGYSFPALCAGWEPRQPQFHIEHTGGGNNEARFVLQMPFSKKVVDMKAFCDDDEHRLGFDPRKLRNDQVRYPLIRNKTRSMAPYNVTVQSSLQNIRELYLRGLMGHFGEDLQEAKFLSPLLHLLSSYEPMKDWCGRQHPSWDSQKCAAFYSLGHDPDHYDYVGEARNASLKEDCSLQFYFNLYDATVSMAPDTILWVLSTTTLVMAGIMHMTSLVMSKRSVLIAVAVGNVLLSLPSFMRLQNRLAPDFTAYVN